MKRLLIAVLLLGITPVPRLPHPTEPCKCCYGTGWHVTIVPWHWFRCDPCYGTGRTPVRK